MPALKIEKSKWLILGIKAFSIKGVQGINVEQMSKKLDCNKSSFYWHFKSRENFINEMIQYWFENSVKPIAENVNKEGNSKVRFEKFLKLSFKDKSRKDLMYHLRTLSKKNAKVKKLLDDLTYRRLLYASSLIQELGYSQKEADIKSEILLNFYIGWHENNKYKRTNCDKDIKYAIRLIKNFINF